MIAGLITNGYLLVAERIQRLNRAGLEWLQISIDNVTPDDVSKKSLKVLDKKLQLLAEHADFHVNINSVVGGGVCNPQDALTIGKRALDLGFSSTIGIIHDGSGQLQPLADEEKRVYHEMKAMEKSSFTRINGFQDNIAAGPAQPVALPGRRALSIYLREWPGALLLATARISRDSAGEVHRRRHSPRVRDREILRSALHRLLRASGIDLRFLARSAAYGGERFNCA